MIDIKSYTTLFLKQLNDHFKDRIYFVGLQGSYGRNEANDDSDIDMVVILDELMIDDIKRYNEMLDHLPRRNLMCGFLAGKKELKNWDHADLFQFYYDTTPIVGSLDDLLKMIDQQAIDRGIKMGVCNIYHGCIHNILYDKNDEILKGLYKAASFVVQAIVFKQNGHYVKQQKQLVEVAKSDEQKILKTFIDIKENVIKDFDLQSAILFEWAKKLLINK